MREQKIIKTNEIGQRIYTIRGFQVMLDTDLAEIYQVETKRLKESVKRNSKRFPSDFMFKLSEHETENLRSQNATSSLENSLNIDMKPILRSHFATSSLKELLLSMEVAVICILFLLNRVLRCFQVFCIVQGLFR